MGFLTPYMLWGALAAGIPLAIHLFFRSRYRTVPWAAMKFLLTSVEETSRRLKIQELLLLVLRMAMLAVLALAFARPISSVLRGGGRGDAVDAVFVMDTSFSMGAGDGAKSRLERARAQAVKIVDELPPHSTVQIVTTAVNSKALLGPRSPANLDQARLLLQNLEITDLATDLYPGVALAQEVLARGQASNKEIYLFSDMQKLGWEQEAGELKQALAEIKEKAVVHLVRCGTQTIKNVAIVGITPQTGVPRPGERVGFAVLVRNTGSQEIDNLTVSLAVDGDEKDVESQAVTKLPPRETRAVTLAAKFDKAGLRVLTARVKQDDLEADNRFDQVVLVRDQVNILVVDGNYHEREPDMSSSFFLMNALLPQVKDSDRATFYLQPRVVSARLASPALLAKQDICILANVSLQARLDARAEVLPADFVAALDGFVRQGHGLMIFAGDNVQPEPYNKLLGKKLGLLPMALKPTVKTPDKEPAFVNRTTFGNGPPAFWTFRDDKRYEAFDGVAVWQYLGMDENISADIENLRFSFYRQSWRSLPDFSQFKADEEGKLPKGMFDLSPRSQNKDFGFVFEGTLAVPETGEYTFYLDAADGARLSISGEPVLAYDGLHEMGAENKVAVELIKGKQPIKLEYFQHASRPGLAVAWSGPGFSRRPLAAAKDDSPASVVVRLNNGAPLVAAKKVDGGEVIFVGTAADAPVAFEKKLHRTWSIWPMVRPAHLPFLHVSVNYLLSGQVQNHNLVAGETLNWHPTQKQDNVYSLGHPDRKTVRLGVPERIGKRFLVTANDLARAGVYRLTSSPRGSESPGTPDSLDVLKGGTPFAVVPDLRESADLETLTDAQLDELVGFQPIHIIAGEATGAATGADRLNREWTVWALMAVLMLVLGESLLAWWCGRAL